MTLPAPDLRSTPTQEILEGLGRLHPYVLLATESGRVAWMNETLRKRLCEDPKVAALGAAGHDHLLTTLVAHLPKPEQLDVLREGLARTGHAGGVQLDIGTGHGTHVSVEASAFAVGGLDTGQRHYVVIARPQKEPERNERELRSDLHLLDQIIDSSPHGVIVTDRSGYVRHANPQAATLLGRPGEQLTGSPIAAFLPESHGFEDLLHKLREPTGWDGEEIEQTDASGQVHCVSVSTRPLLDADGRNTGVIAYLRDVTERREVQRQLQQKNQELESYVDSVAHDLRSPLVSLLGFTRLLKQDYADVIDETGYHFLDRVEEAGRTMDGLIHDLLELARIRRPGELVSLTDPRRILVQVEAELKLRLEAADVTLVLPDAPPMMRVDGTRLYQIFSNLIGNALTHGLNDPRVGGRIAVAIHETCDQHEIEVRDDGCGISEDDQERIFAVFQTGRGVRRGEHSHGIGLAIVKKIAEAHGGRVWVESKPGTGACFHIAFPR